MIRKMNLPAELPPTARVRPFRKLTTGTVLGAVIAGGLIAQVEARHQWMREEVREVPAPRSYTGPVFGAAGIKATFGGEWLGVSRTVGLLRAERLDANPQLGSGYSAARGGPGADWGPVARPEAAARPSWAFAGLNAAVGRMPNPTHRPAFIAQPDQRLDQFRDSLAVVMSSPGHLQWTREED